jgi:CYTH domain-containing protein
MADDLEIEKKWIIDKNKIPYDLEKAEKIEIEQTYINFSPEIRVRKINAGQQYTFAVKTNITEDGMTRNELEENITEEEYKSMITKKEGNTIYKTRYQFLDGDYLLAIDIFSGDLEGLAYLEIEFENHEIANNYETPDWIIKDVTSDLNYKNGHLARYGIPESYCEYMK